MKNFISTNNYPRVKVRGPDGVARYSYMKKDAISKSTFDMDKVQLKVVMIDNNLADRLLPLWKDKGAGHFRMILGQALRFKLLRGETVKVGSRRIKTADQEVAWPKGYKEEAKGTVGAYIRKGVKVNHRTPEERKEVRRLSAKTRRAKAKVSKPFDFAKRSDANLASLSGKKPKKAKPTKK